MKYLKNLLVIAFASLLAVPILAQEEASPSDAEEYTKAMNEALYDELEFVFDPDDGEAENKDDDYENAELGLIDRPPSLVICSEGSDSADCAEGTKVWDLDSYDFIDEGPVHDEEGHRAPDTVNPSLWRNAQLNMRYGLFRVTGECTDMHRPEGDAELDNSCLERETRGIYQVRGYDLSNITFVKGNSGWIVLDPLISSETAKAALDLINTRHGNGGLPVVAVIYSHSHADHYGGAGGLFEGDERDAVFLAPEGFTEHAVSENVIAGNAMSRRSMYMYGARLDRNPKGSVSAGLGQTTSTGVAGLILPTVFISEDGEAPLDAQGDPIELDADGETDISGASSVEVTYTSSGLDIGQYTVDGVEMHFQMTPGTEAPAEMNTWFPQLKALWMAENATNTLHNVLTLRGAQVRDASKWAAFLNETIETWGSEVLVKFQSHHWPLWASEAGDNSNIITYLKRQRDIYRFTHDQTVRMMNNGLTGEEISEKITLPESLEKNWATRGYYGTLRHNSRAVYQYYMGWYDGHPSDLNNLPPDQVAARYVDYMSCGGGPDQILTKAVNEYNAASQVAGQGSNAETYRWLAEVLKHLVFAQDPQKEGPTEAELLLAKVLEQLGYMSESGPWRSVYLQGADELRNGKLDAPDDATTATPETLEAMPPEMVFDFFAVHLCPDQAAVNDSNNDCSVPAEDGDENGGPLEIYVTIESQQPGWNDQFLLTVDNAVLNYSVVDSPPAGTDLTLSLSMEELHDWMQGNENIDDTVANNPDVFQRFKSMLDLEDDITFNIIRP